jgi:hypothetical protein
MLDSIAENYFEYWRLGKLNKCTSGKVSLSLVVLKCMAKESQIDTFFILHIFGYTQRMGKMKTLDGDHTRVQECSGVSNTGTYFEGSRMR